MITRQATRIPARRSTSLPGSAGSRSWNSQVPVIRKNTLPTTLDTGTTMEARQACSAAWNSSMATPEQTPMAYR
jgi:hypothetical protein